MSASLPAFGWSRSLHSGLSAVAEVVAPSAVVVVAVESLADGDDRLLSGVVAEEVAPEVASVLDSAAPEVVLSEAVLEVSEVEALGDSVLAASEDEALGDSVPDAVEDVVPGAVMLELPDVVSALELVCAQTGAAPRRAARAKVLR